MNELTTNAMGTEWTHVLSNGFTHNIAAYRRRWGAHLHSSFFCALCWMVNWLLYINVKKITFFVGGLAINFEIFFLWIGISNGLPVIRCASHLMRLIWSSLLDWLFVIHYYIRLCESIIVVTFALGIKMSFFKKSSWRAFIYFFIEVKVNVKNISLLSFEFDRTITGVICWNKNIKNRATH